MRVKVIARGFQLPIQRSIDAFVAGVVNLDVNPDAPTDILFTDPNAEQKSLEITLPKGTAYGPLVADLHGLLANVKITLVFEGEEEQ